MNSKIKILYCITKSVWGGAGKYVLELATALPKDKFDVAVVLGGNGILTEKLKAENIRTISFSSLERDVNILKDIQVFKELLKTFEEERPEVIHLNSSKIGGLGALAGRIAGVPKILFTAHGWPFNENRNFASKVAIWLASWITTLLSTKTIVINSRDLKQAQKFPFCRKKIELIHNGIKDPCFFCNAEEAKKILSEKIKSHDLSGKTIIGNIAELHKNKGVIYALKAIATLPEKIMKDIVFIVMGDGEEKNDLEMYIKEHGLQKHVILPGFIENAGRYVSAFDIFLFPSIKEGLPYAIMEAGLSSVPVITTNVGGIPDIIENERTGLLISPKKPAEIKTAILDLIGDKEKAKRLGKDLHKKIMAEFGFEKMLEKTIKVYKV